MEPGDKIIEINGEQIAGWTFWKVQEKFEHKRKGQVPRPPRCIHTECSAARAGGVFREDTDA